MFFKPIIKDASSIMATTYLSAMGGSSSIDMINRQEFNVGLTTTSAYGSAVCRKNVRLQFSFALFRVAFVLVSIIVRVLSKVLWVSLIPISNLCSILFWVFVGHKNAASNQLAALTRQAGERQLEVIIP